MTLAIAIALYPECLRDVTQAAGQGRDDEPHDVDGILAVCRREHIGLRLEIWRAWLELIPHGAGDPDVEEIASREPLECFVGSSLRDAYLPCHRGCVPPTLAVVETGDEDQ